MDNEMNFDRSGKFVNGTQGNKKRKTSKKTSSFGLIESANPGLQVECNL